MRPCRTRAAATAAVAVLATCVTSTAAASAQTQTGQTPAWLLRLNDVRVAAGVSPVTENSAWSLGLQHHLTYLELTPSSYRTGDYASMHTENPASPYYTTDGALEGSRSNLVHNASQTSTSGVDYWLAAPFHALGMLRAGLQQTAYAQDSSYAGLDVISGYNSTIRTSSPILFPGPGSTTYLTSYAGNESPDPIETCQRTDPGADYGAPGLPLIAMLPAAPAANLSATLTTPSGTVLSSKTADLCVVDEDTYYSSDGVYGTTGQQLLTADHAVFLVPRTRLVEGTYSASIVQPKQPEISWSFTVAPTATPAAPGVSVSAAACSYGTRSTGSASLLVTNPADGAGTATYTVSIGDRSAGVTVADGGSGSVTVAGLPAGAQDGSLAGSDGTTTAFSIAVPTCPAYQGVRVSIRKITGHRVRVRLDNTRNARATTFRIVVGTDGTRHRVPAAGTDTVTKRLHGAVRVRVYVGRHLVARERLGG